MPSPVTSDPLALLVWALNHFQGDSVRVHEIDGPAAFVGAGGGADWLRLEVDSGGRQGAVGGPEVVDGEADVEVADVVGRARRGCAFRRDVLDQVQVEAWDVEAGDLQSGAGDADQAGHVLGGDFAAFVRDVETEDVAVEGH